MLEGGTKDEMRICEALFSGSLPKLTTHTTEKRFTNPHLIFCSSFQHRRWGRMTLSDKSSLVHLVTLTDTSLACYQHLVTLTDTSSFCHIVNPSTFTPRGEFYCPTHRVSSVHDSTLSRQTSHRLRTFHCIFCSSFQNLRLGQPSATSPLFFDNLHFEHFDKSVNHESRLTPLSKCSKWRLSKKRGLVADGCPKRRFWTVERTSRWVSSKHFSRVWVPHETLKSASNRIIERFVQHSKIFVWEP